MARNNLKLPSGQIISGSDPNYDIYLKQGATVISSGNNSQNKPQNSPSQTSSAQKGITYQPNTNTANNDLKSRVQATQGDLTATPDFVNNIYKAYYNRDATQDELNKWQGQPVSKIRQALTPNSNSGNEVMTLDSQPKFSIPSVDTAGTTDAFVKSVSALWEKMNQPTDTENQYQQAINQGEKNLLNLYNQENKIPQARAKLETQFDIAGKEQKIQQTQAEMNQKIAEYNLMKEKVASEPILSASIAGQQAHLKRVLAAEIAVDSAKLAGYQGQYDLAEKQIQKALDQEFGAIKNNIEATKTFLEINSNHFNSEQKKQAEKVNFVLNEMDKLYTQQRNDKEDNYKILLNVIANGGDGSTVDFNKSPEENLVTNADYLSDKGLTTKTVKAGGREWLVTYDAYGNVINKVDMGSAYRGSGSGSGSGSDNDQVDFYVSEIQSGNPLYKVKNIVGMPTDKINWTKIPSKYRAKIRKKLMANSNNQSSQDALDELLNQQDDNSNDSNWFSNQWKKVKSGWNWLKDTLGI